jgi:hypothetical protein
VSPRVIIPRTPFEGPLWRCGHPRTEENTSCSSCKFCQRVRHLNAYHERVKPMRQAKGQLTMGQRIAAEGID